MKRIVLFLSLLLISVSGFAKTQSPFKPVTGHQFDVMDPCNYYYVTVEVSYSGMPIYTSGEGVVAEFFGDLPFNMRESVTKEWNKFMSYAEKNPTGVYSDIAYSIDSNGYITFTLKKWKVKLNTGGTNIFSKMTYGR